MKIREVPGLWLFYALTGASLWGISGTVSSIIFIKFHFPVISLLMFRMLISGLFLFLLYRPRLPRKNFSLFLVYSIAGLTGVQFTYLETIALTNASTATILQYLYLPMVVLYTVISGFESTVYNAAVTADKSPKIRPKGLIMIDRGSPGKPVISSKRPIIVTKIATVRSLVILAEPLITV